MVESEDRESERSERCASYLKAMADPHRLRIIRALGYGELSVSDLANLLEEDISKISHHLRVLYHAAIVTTYRNGKFIYYRLNKELAIKRTVGGSLDFGCCKFVLGE